MKLWAVAALLAVLLATTRARRHSLGGTLVHEYIALAEHYGHRNELIPLSLALRTLKEGQAGLLALFLGVANWGVDWQGHRPPASPTGSWEGVGRHDGKHLTDYDQGGLGIAHYDTDSLQEIYQTWGRPFGIPRSELAKDYNTIRRGVWWGPWQVWAGRLVAQHAFLDWSIRKWLADYWVDAERTNRGIEAQAVNARLRNSASSFGRAQAGKPVSEQIAAYVARAGDRADHARRQANHARKVGVVADYLGF